VKEIKDLVEAISLLHEERERVTQEALDAWIKVEEFIRNKFDRGTVIKVNGDTQDIFMKVAYIRSNIGGYHTLLFRRESIYGEYEWVDIPDKVKNFGWGYYLHGDFHCWLDVADRNYTLTILRNAKRILAKVKEKLEQQVKEAKEVAKEVEEVNIE